MTQVFGDDAGGATCAMPAELFREAAEGASVGWALRSRGSPLGALKAAPLAMDVSDGPASQNACINRCGMFVCKRMESDQRS